MRAIVSKLQENAPYAKITKSANALSEKNREKNALPPKSYFVKNGMFSNITGDMIPQPKGKVYRSEDDDEELEKHLSRVRIK